MTGTYPHRRVCGSSLHVIGFHIATGTGLGTDDFDWGEAEDDALGVEEHGLVAEGDVVRKGRVPGTIVVLNDFESCCAVEDNRVIVRF